MFGKFSLSLRSLALTGKCALATFENYRRVKNP